VSNEQTFRMRRGQPECVEADASKTVALIRTYLPEHRAKVEIKQNGWWTVELPHPASADYQFRLHGEPGGERQISARPIRTTESRPRNRFWSLRMELAGSSDDASKLEEAFLETVKALMSSPTRIVERKGVIWRSYKGAYQTEGGWQRMGSAFYLALGFGIPFVAKKIVYTSPPVGSFAQV
jgi:hypothetical protein